MARIDEESAARRLARAIASDIQLYNAQAIDRGDDLSAEIEEARQLFRGRVAVDLQRVFEEEVASLQPSSQQAPPAAAAPPRSASPFASFYDKPAPAPSRGGCGAAGLVAALLALGVAVVLLLLRE